MGRPEVLLNTPERSGGSRGVRLNGTLEGVVVSRLQRILALQDERYMPWAVRYDALSVTPGAVEDPFDLSVLQQVAHQLSCTLGSPGGSGFVVLVQRL